MGGKSKNHLRRAVHAFASARSWQILLILIPLLFLTATLLRFDHLKMVKLRSAVLEADASGDEETLSNSLETLRNFVFSHTIVNVVEMNGVQSVIFGTGPFYLENQYRRAANAAIEAAESELSDDHNPHGNIYAAVSAICRPLAIANGWSWNSPGYLDCWTSELAKYPASDNLDANLAANVPSTDLYRISYASPIWSFTWAGLAILLSIILMIVLAIRFIIWCVLTIALLVLDKHN